MVLGLVSLVVVYIYGVVGYCFAGWSVDDAAYMVTITLSTVGFGEVMPIDTTFERLHTMLLIFLGVILVANIAAGFLQLITEGEIQAYLGVQRVQRTIDSLSGHTIVVGFGRMGSLTCEELAQKKMPFVVIERISERIPEIERLGYPFLQGDGTEEAILLQAGLVRAKTLVSVVPSDAENVFITLTARQLAPQVQIIARAELPSTLKKLKHAGAHQVVLPAAIGARRIVSLLTNPSALEFVELVTSRSSLEIEIDEAPISQECSLAGQSLRASMIRTKTNVVVVAVKHSDGRLEFPPSPDSILQVGDSLVLLGSRSNLKLFHTEFQTR